MAQFIFINLISQTKTSRHTTFLWMDRNSLHIGRTATLTNHMCCRQTVSKLKLSIKNFRGLLLITAGSLKGVESSYLIGKWYAFLCWKEYRKIQCHTVEFPTCLWQLCSVIVEAKLKPQSVARHKGPSFIGNMQVHIFMCSFLHRISKYA